MLVGAKMNWSQAMRAAMERLGVDSVTREARKLYHLVAAGPKTTVVVLVVRLGLKCFFF